MPQDGKTPPLPMDEDGRRVWQNFAEFFTAYVEVFYPEGGEKTVEADPELIAYVIRALFNLSLSQFWAFLRISLTGILTGSANDTM